MIEGLEDIEEMSLTSPQIEYNAALAAAAAAAESEAAASLSRAVTAAAADAPKAGSSNPVEEVPGGKEKVVKKRELKLFDDVDKKDNGVTETKKRSRRRKQLQNDGGDTDTLKPVIDCWSKKSTS